MNFSRLAPIAIWIVALFGFWYALSGRGEGLLLIFAGISIIFVVFLAHRLGILPQKGAGMQEKQALAQDQSSQRSQISQRSMPSRPFLPSFSRLQAICSYCLWLVKEIFLSNITVLRLLLMPKPAITPAIIRFCPNRKSELIKTIQANSITLTPGTATLDVDQDGNFTVHALCHDMGATLDGGDMDRRLDQIEWGS